MDRPVEITMDRHDADSFSIVVNAPFFSDPSPPGPPGQAFYGLWDYEVVEVFFLNDKNQYVEIELGPHGQHIVLLLNGQRKTVRHSLPLNYSATIASSGMWRGVAIVPIEYLPPNVSRMNAYAIHGTGNKRVYESLFPVPPGTPGPDFHNLSFFGPFDPNIIVGTPVTRFSPTWLDSLNGIRTLEISRTWANESLSSNEVAKLTLSIMNSTSLNVTIDAPFYNDPAPEGSPSGGPLDSLSSYEVIHLFLLSTTGEYLELEFGPWNHYLVAFWSDSKVQAGNLSAEIHYSARRNSSRWDATAVFPLSYLPPNVTKCNAHLAHGPKETGRKVSSLYPAGPAIAYDFHNASFYRAIDFDILYPKTADWSCSPLWYSIYPQCGSGATSFLLNQPLLAASLFAFVLTYVFKAV